MIRPEIIIIEGTDGTGKTSLAKKLEEQGYKYIHKGEPTANNWQAEYIEPLEDAFAECNRIVADRWHFGEVVWPGIFGRPSLFSSPAEFIACHNRIIEMGALVIILVRDGLQILGELQSRNEPIESIKASLDGGLAFRDIAATGIHGVVVCELHTAERLLGV